MSLKYLLDTNIISEAKRPLPNENVTQNIKLYSQEIATASVVINELLFGILRLPISKKRQDLEDYLDNVIIANMPILDYDLKSAQYHAQERVRLSKIGKTPAFADGQIASIAFSNDLILVTNNVSDFADFNGLTVANWFEG
ncbi:MAG: type II toxin-antitoxin system VapC family toxin [Cyanobacteria bacterium]|nr:type II toxin-antitoxin system VapC family toxin [Cyanobacteria bacterium CG_2015-16_32_12]NCO77470.1 type II toxin-antitoxin system VapC family toxin [Cyanobacteria bacterium CG_2015-22_32_23]NCQ04063.1 type II toxin-antitoxin system VapC family toxin [Cyanobacteria bacterium CG_2015-09_32_10]NCQ42418.1 type II toxin-antitoxin system VapC family toxin [Cyanobacteria bacterium CG_2015-04_32_10]NCS84073.1 type II toxin-antitoxin system VapC family toxin [Cyanobacteria bacterium CG_2015-02_32_